MTTDLRDHLDDLLAEVPAYVAPDAAAAWRAGGRRRSRRRVRTAATVISVLALFGAVVTAGVHATVVPPADGQSPGPRATGYPTRIDAPLLRTGTLPDRPGPVAGLLERDAGWFALGQRGQVWRIPGAADRADLASISPDGGRIAYVDRSHGRSELTLLDLVHGGAFTPGIGGAGSSHHRLLRSHGETFWSPDSTRLLVPVRPGPHAEALPNVDAALLVTPGKADGYVRPPGGDRVEPIGWLSNDRLAWLRWVGPRPRADLVTTDLRGHPLASHPVPARLPVGEYVGASLIPPDRGSSHILSVTTTERRFLVSNPGRGPADSARVSSRRISKPLSSACPASWAAGSPAYPVVGPDFHVLWTGPGSYDVQVDPALLPWYCSVWAHDALGGSPHGGLGGRVFGERADWLSWHWRQVAIGSGALLSVLLALKVVGVLRRRRRRLTVSLPPG